MNKDDTGPVEIHPPAEGETGLRFVYADGVEMIHGGPSGCTFEGTEGTIYVDRKGIESTPKSILETPLAEKDTSTCPMSVRATNRIGTPSEGIR